MTLSRMVKDGMIVAFVFIVLVDFASSLYLSQSNVTMEPGKSLAISCRDPGGQPVVWKGPKAMLSAYTKPKIQDTSIGKLLVFTPTRLEDAGNYTCSLMSNKNEFRVFSLYMEKTTDIETETTDYTYTGPYGHYTAKDPTDSTEIESETTDHPYTPSYEQNTTEEPIQFIGTPEEQRGIEGENVTIRCEVNRPYQIHWIPDRSKDPEENRYIAIGDGLLIVNVSRKEDNRVFICEVVKSSLGKFVQQKINFTVEYKPILLSDPPDPEIGELQSDDVYGFLNEQVNLTCEVEAVPPPKFEWKRSSQKQGIGRIIHEGTHKSILQLKMTEHTVDKYQCTASNKFGSVNKNFNLQIGTKPDGPEYIELIKAGTDNLELQVGIPVIDEEALKNKMEPRWLNIYYKNENSEYWDEQVFRIESETYILNQLNSSTKYEIFARTRNIAGHSSPSNTTIFETKSASSVQISNLNFFSVAMINLVIFLTSRLA